MPERDRPPDVRDAAEKAALARPKPPGGYGTPHTTQGAGEGADGLSAARNVAFFATVTDDAITYFCRLPKTWKAAFTADPAYPVSDQVITAVKASGHRPFAWCDCRTTLPPDAMRMALFRGLDGWYGQGESAREFDVATTWTGNRAPVAVVGNLSALNPAQLARVSAAETLFINETYYNVQPNLKPDWRGANNGVGGNCWAFYASESEGAVHTPIDSRFNPETDSIYTEGMLESDWKAIA